MRRDASAREFPKSLVRVACAQEGPATYSRTCHEMHDRAPRFGVAVKEAGRRLARKMGEMATWNVATVRCTAGRRVFQVKKLQAVMGGGILRHVMKHVKIVCPIETFVLTFGRILRYENSTNPYPTPLHT